MPLMGFASHCGERARIIVSRDRFTRREHRANNPAGCRVFHYRVDGEVIRSGERCDYLLLNDDRKTAYLIELKGSDLEHGIDQIEATEEALKAELHGYARYYRLIHSRARTHEIYGTKLKAFRHRHPGKEVFLCKETLLEENI